MEVQVRAETTDKHFVENVAAAVVREYLHGKGYQKTLSCIDTEMARTDDSISSRVLLAKLLHLEKLLKKNKHDKAFKTMLEVLVKHFLSHSKSRKKLTLVDLESKSTQQEPSFTVQQLNNKDEPVVGDSLPEVAPDQQSQNNSQNLLQDLDPGRPAEIDNVTIMEAKFSLTETSKTSFLLKNCVEAGNVTVKSNPANADSHYDFKNSERHMKSCTPSDRKQISKSTLFRNLQQYSTENKTLGRVDIICDIDDLETAHLLSDSKTENLIESIVKGDFVALPENVDTLPTSGTVGSETKPNELPTVGGRPLGTSQDDGIDTPAFNNTQQTTKRPGIQHRMFSGPIARGGLQNDRGKRASATKRNFLSTNQPVKLDPASIHAENVSAVVTTKHETRVDEGSVAAEEVTSGDVSEPRLEQNCPKNNEMGNWLANEPATPRLVKNAVLRIAMTCKHEDLEVGDLDEMEESNSGVLVSQDPSYVWLTMPQGTPIQYEIAVELKTLLLGSSKKNFPNEWKIQNFCFSDNPKLGYGIVQKKGGPCGVLACVQAYIIKELMFAKSRKSSTNCEFSKEECKKCLALALAQILWKAGSAHKATIAMPSSRTVAGLSGLSDGLIEKINLMQFTDLAALQSFLIRHVAWFMEDNKYPCISFLYSAMLSRGLDKVKKDMDDPSSCLIGEYGYCSQEVVNLLLTGCASTNVFDKVITLDDGKESRSVLKGVMRRSEIGFLALFEHYNSCEVGSFLKCPRYPVWVVCSESHFSVLFAKDRAVRDFSTNNADGNEFELYYYDGLLQHEDEIKLSIHLASSLPTVYPKDLVPPLDHCIRTKWKDAHIDWNGTEPLL